MGQNELWSLTQFDHLVNIKSFRIWLHILLYIMLHISICIVQNVTVSWLSVVFILLRKPVDVCDTKGQPRAGESMLWTHLLFTYCFPVICSPFPVLLYCSRSSSMVIFSMFFW